MIAHPGAWDGRPLDPSTAIERLQAYRSTFGQKSLLLAAHTAVLERLRADVVALIRRNFFVGADQLKVHCDADVLFGPLTLDEGGGFFRMDREVRRLLLKALDAYGATSGRETYYSAEVASFVRCFADHTRRHDARAAMPVFRDYLNEIDWVALAIDDPERAAQALFSRVQAGLSADGDASNRVRLGGVASLLRLPMSAIQDDLLLADFHDRIIVDDFEGAADVAAPILNRRYEIAGVELATPAELLASRRPPGLGADVSRRHARRVAAGPAVEGLGLGRDADAPARASTSAEDNALHLAAAAGDADDVGELVKSGAYDLDALGAEGFAPLHIAARRDDAAVARLLIEGGGKVDIENPRGSSPLSLAAERGNEEVGRILLEAEADVDKSNLSLSTPLLFAAHFGHLSFVAMLLEARARPNVVNNEGYTPLGAAAQLGSLEMFDMLVAHGAVPAAPEDGTWNELLLVGLSGHTGIAEKLINVGFPVDLRCPREWTPLMNAASRGHAPLVSLLAEVGANLDARNRDRWTALGLASFWNFSQTVSELARYGADLNATMQGGQTALHVAARQANAEAISTLLEFAGTRSTLTVAGDTALALAVGAKSRDAVAALLADSRIDPNQPSGAQSTPPVWLAAEQQSWDVLEALAGDSRTLLSVRQKGKVLLSRLVADEADDTVIMLLRHGADPNLRNDDGETALATAVRMSRTTSIAALLEFGGNVHQRVADDGSLLHLAAAQPQPQSEVIELLLDAGVEAESRDRFGRTALHVAAEAGSADVLAALAKRPGLASLIDASGMTPLLAAICAGNPETAMWLIEAKLDVAPWLDNGWTALHLAAQRDLTGVMRALIESGADMEALSRVRPMTPLQAAAEAGATQACELLLGAGARAGRATRQCGPALVLALRNGHFETALQLLRGGAGAAVADAESGATAQEIFRDRLRRSGTPAPANEVERELAERLAIRALPPRGIFPQAPTAPPAAEPARDTRSAAPPQSPATEPAGLTPGTTQSAAHATASATVRVRRSGTFVAQVDATAGEPGPWRHLDSTARSRLLEELGPRPFAGRHHIDAAGSEIVAMGLPFYDSAELIRLRDSARMPSNLSLFLLRTAAGLAWLNGTSPPIHQANAKAPIRLDADNAADYLRFFCFFVRGEEGPFYVLESMEDECAPRDADDAIRSIFAGTVRPVSFEGRNEKGLWLLDAVVWYSNAIFISNFAIHPTGMLDMLGDEPMAGDLPVKPDVPIA